MPAPSAAAPAASSTAGKPSGPTARAEAHAVKKKSKETRRNRSPGPGAYSPNPIGPKRGGDGKASSSFMSKTKRMVGSLGDLGMGDPGSYDPYTLKDLASTSKKSFARSMRAGQGDFGGKEKREINIDIMGEATPGPGAYNGDRLLRSGQVAALSALDTGEKMPSSSFKSTSVQRAKTVNQHVPGAGAYTPIHTAIEPAPTNPGMHCQAKGPRFEAIKQVTDPMVGPGAYESHLEGSVQVSVSKAVAKASRANPGFGTLTQAHDLPFLDAVADAMDDPGPGAYEAPKSALEADGHCSAFKSATKRSVGDLAALSMGDPGSYDPYTNTDLAATSKKSFGKSNRAGQGDFGGKEKREMNIDIMGEATPGPGAYNGDKLLRTGKVAALAALDTGEKMPSSSFKSTSVQRTKAVNQHVPGAGAYTPNFHIIEDARMATNSGAGMRGKGPRFQGQDKQQRDQAAEPGPGAYETEILRTGGRSNLSAWDTGELMPSGAFASDTIRDLPWPGSSTGAAPKAAAGTGL